MLKTNLFVAQQSTVASNPASNNVTASAGRMFLHILRTEGPSAFLKGWTASYVRSVGAKLYVHCILLERYSLSLSRALSLSLSLSQLILRFVPDDVVSPVDVTLVLQTGKNRPADHADNDL